MKKVEQVKQVKQMKQIKQMKQTEQIKQLKQMKQIQRMQRWYTCLFHLLISSAYSICLCRLLLHLFVAPAPCQSELQRRGAHLQASVLIQYVI